LIIYAVLASRGLTSLGRSEAHVQTTLDAAEATLARLAEFGAPRYPDPADMFKGTLALRRQTELIFGRPGNDDATRIMVTLPPDAATDPALVGRILAAGMDCARINCAHDSPPAWEAMIANVRMQAAAAGRDCRILMDLGGCKCRIETVHADHKLRLMRHDRFVLVRSMTDAAASDATIATITFPEILDSLEVGAEVWINDGKLGTRVVAIAPGRVTVEVISARAKGERLRPEKGVNFPSTEVTLDPLTPKDLRDLDFVAEHADIVGFSFVQRASDVTRLQAALTARRQGRPPQPVMLKIETLLAVQNLPRLIVQAGGSHPVAVMIARGDLAVELGFGRMSEMQEEMLWLCEAAHVPVVWATQVLEGLVRDGAPSRAEATDAAMGQRAECIMLNKGPFLVEAITFLRDVLRRMDRHHRKQSPRLGALHSWRLDNLAL
jgi:pyruvate kinase